jgi:hypothetical protein
MYCKLLNSIPGLYYWKMYCKLLNSTWAVLLGRVLHELQLLCCTLSGRSGRNARVRSCNKQKFRLISSPTQGYAMQFLCKNRPFNDAGTPYNHLLRVCVDLSPIFSECQRGISCLKVLSHLSYGLAHRWAVTYRYKV